METSAGDMAMSSLLKMTPLSAQTQSHLVKVYRVLGTCLASAALGVVTHVYTGIGDAGFLSMILVVASMMYFLSLPAYSPHRSSVLHAFAFAQGFATGPLLSLVGEIDSSIPAIAFAATSAIFVGFSISAMFARRRSYLYLGGLLSTALSGLFWISVLGWFWRSSTTFALQLYAGMLVFSGFVLYDTQVIIEKAERGSKDHVQHAFDLFVDFVALFRRVLVIMARNAQKRDEEEERRRQRR